MKLTNKILLSGSAILLITGCATNQPIKSSPNVAKIGYIHTLSDRNAIALEWNLVNKPNIAGYYIQRSSDAKKYNTVKKIENKYITHWTDVNLKPNHLYFYKVSTFTKKGIPSFALLKKVKTLDKLAPIPWIDNANLKTRGMIKILFRPHPNERVKGYKIQRFNDTDAKWETIKTLEPRLRAEYIDKNLVDGKIYKYRIIAYSFDGIDSYPSKVVIAQTLQKPMVVTNISASTDLVKQIKLTWKPVKGAVKYKIYYSFNQNSSFNPLKTTTKTSFVDKINKDGFVKYYKITSINRYGMESIKSQAVMGTTLSIPTKPIVSIINKTNSSVTFSMNSADKRAVKYLIKKDDGDKIINIHNVQSRYIDKNVKKGKTYKYKIYEIDKNGLESQPAELKVSF